MQRLIDLEMPIIAAVKGPGIGPQRGSFTPSSPSAGAPSPRYDPLDEVLPRAHELAETLAVWPQLGMALEGLTAADLAHQKL